jgi:acetoin utilization deacetylase AcuC-like enzyme
MKTFYCDHFTFPLPPNHRFPIQKYALLREAIVEADGMAGVDLVAPTPATDAQILRAHDAAYLDKLQTGRLTRREIRRIGFPWSPELVKRARCSAGATIAACRAALRDGLAANLAGGTHHAFHDHGQGYCLLNDTIIAVRAMQDEGRMRRALVIDCDVHQGNGTAALAAGDPTIFTLSIHNENNFPRHKERSDLDVGLPDGTADAAYLEALEAGVREALTRAEADLVIYLAGADPYAGDRLGRLALSKVGLAARDRRVLELCRGAGLPVATTMAGGYARRTMDTVSIHLQTVRIMAQMARR